MHLRTIAVDAILLSLVFSCSFCLAAGELSLPGGPTLSGQTIYAVMSIGGSTVLAAGGVEASNSAHWTSYTLTATETVAGRFLATVPTIDSGTYDVEWRLRAGGTAALTDWTCGVGVIDWNASGPSAIGLWDATKSLPASDAGSPGGLPVLDIWGQLPIVATGSTAATINSTTATLAAGVLVGDYASGKQPVLASNPGVTPTGNLAFTASNYTGPALNVTATNAVTVTGTPTVTLCSGLLTQLGYLTGPVALQASLSGLTTSLTALLSTFNPIVLNVQSTTVGAAPEVNLVQYQYAALGPLSINASTSQTGKSLAFIVYKPGPPPVATWSLTSSAGQLTVSGTSGKTIVLHDTDQHTSTAGVYRYVLRNLTDDTVVCVGSLTIQPAAKE